jgi:hypothetical protein
MYTNRTCAVALLALVNHGAHRRNTHTQNCRRKHHRCYKRRNQSSEAKGTGPAQDPDEFHGTDPGLKISVDGVRDEQNRIVARLHHSSERLRGFLIRSEGKWSAEPAKVICKWIGQGLRQVNGRRDEGTVFQGFPDGWD